MSLSGFPVLSARTPRLQVPSRQYYRNASSSPTRQQHQQFLQQHVDDLISQLTPANAVQALRHPTGPLKTCLDTATAAEQSFAMRAALAVNSLQEWLDEISDWEWPEAGGSAGFEEPELDIGRPSLTGAHTFYTSTTTPTSSPPQAPARAPSTPETPERDMPAGSRCANGKESDDDLRMGSLLASDVLDYEQRIVEITRDIEDLEVEDMKQQVLHHHILPLSPPGTPPIGGKLRSSASSTSSVPPPKLDDLTAVVTAIVLQALPLLSKLTRLLDVWRIRLIVLKKIPTLLSALSAAEAAIDSAWNAIRLESTTADAGPSPLRREEFAAMKAVVEGKVSKAAQITDFMLDTLDGWEDTIPDAWIDRIDAAERGYGEWVAACERKMREGEWKRSTATATGRATSHNTKEDAEPTTQKDAPMVSQQDASALMLPETPPRQTLSGQSSLESLRSEPQLPSFHLARPAGTTESSSSPLASPFKRSTPSDVLLPSQMDTRDDLPMARGAPQKLRDDMSDLGDISFFPNDGDDGDDLETLPGAGRSPSSSPPNFRASMRSTVTFSDMPTVAEIPDEDCPTAPVTPMESSFTFDDMTNEEMNLSQDMSTPDIADMSSSLGSPASVRQMSQDEQLEKQIMEILGSIPAKIHLSTQPSSSFSHLNPPDFTMPAAAARKPRTPGQPGGTGPDGMAPRSLSSMSTRSMTPSFLLAPAQARNVRSRQQQRGNQDIKLYHLSRSTGEAPIKLFIRLVGEGGERVMVRVGGGWADLSEYLKEYASHHSRRSKSGSEGAKIEIRDLPLPHPASPSVAASLNGRMGSSPPSRPASALDHRRGPESPLAMPALNVRKVRRARGGSTGSEGVDTSAVSFGGSVSGSGMARRPYSIARDGASPPSGESPRSRPGSRMSWTEEECSLGMSGPRAKHVEMSEESKAWVESVKERVRVASGEQRRSVSGGLDGKFGEMGRVGGTKRLFRRGPTGKVVLDK